MIDRPRTSADRMRRLRKRRRQGVEVIAVPVEYVGLTELLIEYGYLAKPDAEDREAVSRATADLVQALVEDG